MEKPELQGEALISVFEMIGLDDEKSDFSDAELLEKLSAYLNELISKDFNKLISILYRIDVSQEKAVSALAENSGAETQGATIARLIINRQIEKLYFRKLYKKRILK